MMEYLFLGCGIVLLLLMALCLVRVVGGPTVFDRILGGNVIGTKTTVLLLIIGVLYRNVAMFVDIAIAYALLNFIATLGAAKYFLRRKHMPGD
ncbi:MAG: monovalent cation/H+ antiporter complex subunit F [Syntrophotalea acetylenica]|jgi:multicomponent Na+:H+ antiporter subunit F|nr:monovalent cation/H+ antiporter complex subunit F [Syntrophotalea acetylenica]MDD4457740.1 monovalent cation/H+ antiporter complex subunit F [Syntrophotalea acetylenica]MDY0261690.1 monovalent cation/H+ antiporter complex subunit F [Syntrophotalea acetylenica]